MVELIDPSVFKNLPQVTSTISFGPNGLPGGLPGGLPNGLPTS